MRNEHYYHNSRGHILPLLRELFVFSLFAVGLLFAQVVESADTTDLKSVGIRHEGSNPSQGTNSQCCELWVHIPYTSWHNSDKAYNEDNLGIGLEVVLSPSWSFLLEHYKNSANRWSTLTGVNWSPQIMQMHLWEVIIKPGIWSGIGTGYTHRTEPFILPSIQIEVSNKVGASFIYSNRFVGMAWKLHF